MDEPVLLCPRTELHSLYAAQHPSHQLDKIKKATQAPNCSNIPRAHHRLVISHNFLQAVTLPGLDFIKAWADCMSDLVVDHAEHVDLSICEGRLACIKLKDALELPSLSFRDLLWNPVDNEGVLTDFDLDSSSRQIPEIDWMLSVAELLTCKAVCDNRSLRLSRDQMEPYVWMVTSTYLHAFDQHE